MKSESVVDQVRDGVVGNLFVMIGIGQKQDQGFGSTKALSIEEEGAVSAVKRVSEGDEK